MYLCRMIRRGTYGLLTRLLSQKTVTLVTGARQLGKTTLLQQLEADLKAKGEHVRYLSLEDPAVLRNLNEHPDQLFRYIPNPETTDGKRVYVMLDEIQYAGDPSRLLKYLYDTYSPKLKLVVTGSSAFYFDHHFKDSLAGRKRLVPLYPLSFEEFIRFKNEQELMSELPLIRSQADYLSVRAPRINALIEEYLRYGGYPAVVLEADEKEKKALLTELRSSVLRKDIRESGIEQEAKFYKLVQLLASSVGGQVNKSELANTLQINVRTVENYLLVLQKCFHISLIPPFSSNLRKELTQMPRVYFNDTGLRNSLLGTYSPMPGRADKGFLLENFFYHQLRQQVDPDQIWYWRTTDQKEVDFVWKNTSGTTQAAELKWNEREFNPNKYRKFRSYYPDIPLMPVALEAHTPRHWLGKWC